MKKIYIDKSDSVASVVERILATSENEIVLYIPRFTKLASSANFKLLKREIHASGKSVEIESVDDEVLELAKALGINASNPFFRKNRRPMSDILSPGENPKLEHHKIGHKVSIKEEDTAFTKYEEKEIEEDIQEEQSEEMEKAEVAGVEEYHHRSHNHHPKAAFFAKLKPVNKIKSLAILGIVGLLIAGAMIILPTAKVKATLEKINWDFNGSLVASASIKDPYLANGQVKVGGIVLEKNKNITNSYPATGTETVSRKASGRLAVYNAYSSAPQALVRDTRFSSPDGKIFRIAQGIVVPGAKIVDNKIVPSSIEVTVYADKPGAEYNIMPTRFRIPGFQGSPKYDGFYAESFAPISGGFVGVAKVPTEGDMLKAKEKNRKILEDILNAEASLSIPADIKIIDKAGRFVVLREEINKVTDDSGEFKVTTYGSKKLFGFKEADVLKALEVEIVNEVKLQARTSGAESEVELDLKEHSITYAEPRIDFDKKEMTVVVQFHSVWTRKFDKEAFKAAVLGKRESELGPVVKSFPGVKSVTVNLWPFWVSKIPANPKKVSIDVE